MNNEQPKFEGDAIGSKYTPPVETLRGDDQPYEAVDPATGLVKRYESKGAYMAEQAENKN